MNNIKEATVNGVVGGLYSAGALVTAYTANNFHCGSAIVNRANEYLRQNLNQLTGVIPHSVSSADMVGLQQTAIQQAASKAIEVCGEIRESMLYLKTGMGAFITALLVADSLSYPDLSKKKNPVVEGARGFFAQLVPYTAQYVAPRVWEAVFANQQIFTEGPLETKIVTGAAMIAFAVGSERIIEAVFRLGKKASPVVGRWFNEVVIPPLVEARGELYDETIGRKAIRDERDRRRGLVVEFVRQVISNPNIQIDPDHPLNGEVARLTAPLKESELTRNAQFYQAKDKAREADSLRVNRGLEKLKKRLDGSDIRLEKTRRDVLYDRIRRKLNRGAIARSLHEGTPSLLDHTVQKLPPFLDRSGE